MLRCSKEAFAACPDSTLCGSREDATYTEGSDCDKFNQEISKHPEQYGRWIPMTERLPEDNASILVAAHNGKVVLGSLYRNPFSSTGYSVSNGCAAYSNASHWMPLPVPPKE